MESSESSSVVIACVGHSFDIYLESMVNSTGYGWCLKSLPEGADLISTENIPIRPGIAPVRQIFTFAAIKPLKNGSIVFEMLCLHDLTALPADTATFQIQIHADNENDLLANEIGSKKFIKGAGAMLHAKPAIPYGFVETEKALLMYGFPVGGNTNVIPSNTNCLLKYGTPYGASLDDSECNMKYGYPINIKYGYPTPIYKYGFPLSSASGEKLKLKEVDERLANCIVKYGTPGGVGHDIGDCRIKYGYPLMSEKLKPKSK